MICVIIYNRFNCGKTIMINLPKILMMYFEIMYIYVKSLRQPKYYYLELLLNSIDEIGYLFFLIFLRKKLPEFYIHLRLYNRQNVNTSQLKKILLDRQMLASILFNSVKYEDIKTFDT